MSDDTTIIEGDAVAVLPTLPAAVFDAIVTDPPYALNFMGKKWDVVGVAFDPKTWQSALNLLVPGGYMVCFGGTRTFHRLACAVEDGGFEIRDTLMWLHGQGFPKGKGQMKPAWEPILLCRAPGKGVRPLEIDACRVGMETITTHAKGKAQSMAGTAPPDCTGSHKWRGCEESTHAGRWPANLVLSCECGDGAHGPECPVRLLDEQAGERKGDKPGRKPRVKRAEKFGWSGDAGQDHETAGFTDSGGASRFFYTAKASRRDRGEGNNHPCVKSTALMRWLCRLITPPGGHVLDPFAGSGSTALACLAEGFHCTLIEREAEYVAIARRRIEEAQASTPLFA